MQRRCRWNIFLLGGLCFFISQVVIRIPLIVWINESPSVHLWQMQNALLYGFLLALSAGVVEETGRFLFRKYLLPKSFILWDAIVFGLGHSFVEVLFILHSNQLVGRLDQVHWLVYGERIVATFVHILLSIVVWNGFVQNKQGVFLGFAIFMHFCFNAIVPISQALGLDILWIEIMLLLLTLVYLRFVFQINRMEWRTR